MSQHPADSMQQRAGKAIVAHAIFRVESALTISLTILLAFFLPRPFPWWRWWYWMVLGGVTEALIIYTSLMDERTAQRVVADMLRVRYNPGEIVTPAYRKKVEQALRYRDQLQRIVTTAQPGVLRDHLQNTVTGIAEWMDHIFAVATRLDAYTRDTLLQQDRLEVPKSIAALSSALARESDAEVREQMRTTLEAKELQRANLEALARSMEEAEFRLEATLTALGTVYSQVQLLGVRRVEGGKAQRLSEDVREQVQRLQDVLSTMDQVYGDRLKG